MTIQNTVENQFPLCCNKHFDAASRCRDIAETLLRCQHQINQMFGLSVAVQLWNIMHITAAIDLQCVDWC